MFVAMGSLWILPNRQLRFGGWELVCEPQFPFPFPQTYNLQTSLIRTYRLLPVERDWFTNTCLNSISTIFYEDLFLQIFSLQKIRTQTEWREKSCPFTAHLFKNIAKFSATEVFRVVLIAVWRPTKLNFTQLGDNTFITMIVLKH